MFRSVRYPSAAPVLAASMLVLSGCGQHEFLPPPPPSVATAAPAPEALRPARLVGLVLVSEKRYEASTWIELARAEAGERGVGFRRWALAPGEPAAKQAELIRTAAREASGLIVEPADAEEVATAIDDVRAQGVPVVLIDRPLPAGGGRTAAGTKAATTSVRYPAPGETARRLAEAAVRQAAKSGLPADGHAVVLSDSGGDFQTAERAEALRAALGRAKVPRVTILPFASSRYAAEAALHAARKSDPNVTLVLVTDEMGAHGAVAERSAPDVDGNYAIAGYLAFALEINHDVIDRCAAAADRKTPAMVRRAVGAVVDLMEGRRVPDTIEVPMSLVDHTE